MGCQAHINPIKITNSPEISVQEHILLGRCRHRPLRHKTNIARLPYVKYSTGANETTRAACRALGKPDQTAARRAFLAGRTFGEWYAGSKCLFCATALFRTPASLFCILFSDKPEKSMPPEASRAFGVQKKGRRRLPAAPYLSVISPCTEAPGWRSAPQGS